MSTIPLCAIRNNLHVVYLVVADKQWGMVKMTQQFALRPLKTIIKKSLDDHETINADFCEVEWDKLAQSMGAFGVRVNNPNDLYGAISSFSHSIFFAPKHAQKRISNRCYNLGYRLT